jgi:hypothetical protein
MVCAISGDGLSWIGCPLPQIEADMTVVLMTRWMGNPRRWLGFHAMVSPLTGFIPYTLAVSINGTCNVVRAPT